MLGFIPALEVRAAEATGRVTISYTLTRLSRIASNQLAIWIEDADGRYVRTLFVTDFTGRRAGWKRRPQTLPTWLQMAGVKEARQSDIDSISAATPASGGHTAVWDLEDRHGKAVAPGTYRYRIEANISWENTAMWTGTIEVGGGRTTSRAGVVYTPRDAEKLGTLISEVSALYEPAR